MPLANPTDPILPSNRSIAFDRDEIDHMWAAYEEALADQPDEWNPGNLLMVPLRLMHSAQLPSKKLV